MKIDYATGRRLTVRTYFGATSAQIVVEPNTGFIVHAMMVWAENGVSLNGCTASLVVDGATMFVEQYTERLLWSLPRAHCDPRDLVHPAILSSKNSTAVYINVRDRQYAPPEGTSVTVELVGVAVPTRCYYHPVTLKRPDVY